MFDFLRRQKPDSPVEETLNERIDRVIAQAGEGFIDIGFRSRQFRTGMRRTVTTAPEGEFFQAVEYIPGEHDPKSIMARATMATGGQTIYSKVCRPESQSTVYLLADINHTLNFGHSRESKLELMARCAASVCLSLKETQDLVRAALYANEHIVFRMYRAMTPAVAVRVILQHILQPVYSTGELSSGLEEAIQLLPGRGQSDIILLSDFLNVTEAQYKQLAELAFRNNLRCVVIQDHRERELPEAGWLPSPLKVFDVNTGRQVTWWLTRANRERYAREFREHEENLKRFFEQNGISYEIVSTNEGHESIAKVLRLLASPPLFC